MTPTPPTDAAPASTEDGGTSASTTGNPGDATRPPTRGNGSGPTKVSAAEKRAQAVALRRQGKTFEEIATEVGYANKSSAFRAVDQALKAAVREQAVELIQLETERLDAMLAALWPKIEGGDARSIDTALRLSERRAKLLGLDAAQQVQHSGPDGGAIPVSIGEMTADERRARLEELVHEARRRLEIERAEGEKALVQEPTDAPPLSSGSATV